MNFCVQGLKLFKKPKNQISFHGHFKSHGDDLDKEYLWNGNKYGSLENSLKAMEKMPNIEDNQKS